MRIIDQYYLPDGLIILRAGLLSYIDRDYIHYYNVYKFRPPPTKPKLRRTSAPPCRACHSSLTCCPHHRPTVNRAGQSAAFPCPVVYSQRLVVPSAPPSPLSTRAAGPASAGHPPRRSVPAAAASARNRHATASLPLPVVILAQRASTLPPFGDGRPVLQGGRP
jgi:hypothetical protein